MDYTAGSHLDDVWEAVADEIPGDVASDGAAGHGLEHNQAMVHPQAGVGVRQPSQQPVSQDSVRAR